MIELTLGVDVYSGYGVIDWQAAKQGGVEFAIIKMGEGNEPARDDTSFARNVAGCRAADIACGGYFFPYILRPSDKHPGRPAKEQAQRAFELSKGLGGAAGDIPHMVDLEWPARDDWHDYEIDGAFFSEFSQEYCEESTGLWGRKPVIYTYPYEWAGVQNAGWAAAYDLVLAGYVHSGSGLPQEADLAKRPTPEPWDEWRFLQFSADGSNVRVPGIPRAPVDRDCFRGNVTQLREWCRTYGFSKENPEWPIVHPDVTL